MFRKFAKFTIALSLLATGAQAQDFTAMYDQVVAGNNAYYQQLTNGIVSQNMNNPQIQMAYQQHRAQGGGYSFEQFCYMYGATGGFTPQGMSYYNQVEGNIAAQQQQAWSSYQQSQQNSAQAMQNWRNGYYQNQNEAGNVIQGNQTYYSQNGASQVLPYTWQPGHYYYNNQNYYVDPSYQYYRY